MLYRFNIDLSDIDRGIYQSLDFRIAQHPSETLIYLLCRAIAYIHSYDAQLEFSGAGLSDPEAAALKMTERNGNIKLWIEIGNPSPKKLHKASKMSQIVQIYNYKNSHHLVEEINNADVHKKESLQIFQIEQKFLENIEKILEKNNRWSVLIQQGQFDLNINTNSYVTEIKKITLS